MASPTGPGCTPVGWTAPCPLGFTKDPSGWGCLDVQPANDCDAGTMPVLGNTACQPVGWSEPCPQGFAAHPSGFGCRDLTPSAACAGATREALGQSACQSLADCTATFPPATATVFVDDSFTAGQLDSAHFRTVQAALDAAPADATIAVEAGTYAESLTATRDVTVVGRCAEQVAIVGSFAAPGLSVSGRRVTVRGLTLRGHRPGAQVSSGGDLTLAQVLLTGNQRAGALATGSGTQLTVQGSAARDAQLDSSRAAAGFTAQAGARLTLQDSAASGNRITGVLASGAGTQATVERSVTRDNGTGSELSSGGLWVETGAQLALTQSVVAGARRASVVVRGATSSATLTRCVLRDSAAPAGISVGVFSDGAKVSLERCGVWDHDDVGLVGLSPAAFTVTDSVVATSAGKTGPSGGIELNGAASLTATRTAIVNAGRAGLLAVGASTVTLRDTLVWGTREGSDSTGYQAYGILGNQGPKLTLEGVALVHSQGTGMTLGGAETVAVVRQSLIQGTRAGTRGGTPAGILVSDNAQLELTQSVVADNAGLGLAIGSMTMGQANGAPGTATLERCVVRDTRVDPTWRDSSGLLAQFGSVVSVTDTAFVRNGLSGLSTALPGTTADLVRVVLRESVPDGDEFAYGAFAGQGSTLRLIGSVVRDIRGIGVLANELSSATIDGSLLDGMPAELRARGVRAGFGAVAVDSTLTVSGSAVSRCGNTGVAFQDARGSLASTLLRSNAVGLQVQGSSTLRQVPAVTGEPIALEVLVADDTVFDRNGTKLGSGMVPLPTAPSF